MGKTLAEAAGRMGDTLRDDSHKALRALLYEAVVELEYIQCVENCHSGLCATPKGADIVNRGMELLGVKDLSTETLAEQEAE